jgi:hypothetical protein
MPTLTDPKIVQTTLRLPEPLYREVRELLDEGKLEGDSLNDVVIRALQQSLHFAKEKLIDDQFAGMATDESYAEQCRQLASEFARADWEALPEDVSSRAKG